MRQIGKIHQIGLDELAPKATNWNPGRIGSCVEDHLERSGYVVIVGEIVDRKMMPVAEIDTQRGLIFSYDEGLDRSLAIYEVTKAGREQ
ncbi:MAG: hypothetical protein CMH64_00610 [Nanoarchaeota archaeon]|nr:hypothetical protein [Nanoarchaeota archaeon]|tara:strand:+ start:1823 stop:2089 length:267 start_codon:yes stop_codon:yes gene_type:complete